MTTTLNGQMWVHIRDRTKHELQTLMHSAVQTYRESPSSQAALCETRNSNSMGSSLCSSTQPLDINISSGRSDVRGECVASLDIQLGITVVIYPHISNYQIKSSKLQTTCNRLTHDPHSSVAVFHPCRLQTTLGPGPKSICSTDQ